MRAYISTIASRVIGSALAVVLGLFSFVLVAYAVSYAGWGWGGTPGPDGSADAYQGVGWVSFNYQDIEGATVEYGVEVPEGEGNVTGYAWAGDYGWISFQGADLAGCAGLGQARRNADDTITGGARFLAIKDAFESGNSGGYDGCISLSGSANDGGTYGISVSPDGTLDGYAWSSDLGYIDLDDVYPLGVTGKPSMPIITHVDGEKIVDEDQTFGFYATDPNLDRIQYHVDWDDDGTVDDVYPSSGYVNSGVSQEGMYAWSSDGAYTIRAKTVDETGDESGWASLIVQIGAGTSPTPSEKGICTPDYSVSTAAELCPGADEGFTGNKPSSLTGNGGCNPTIKCQYQCKTGFAFNGTDECIDVTGGTPLPQ
jgi:hypothetical protein